MDPAGGQAAPAVLQQLDPRGTPSPPPSPQLYGKLEETPVSVFEKTQDVYRIRPSFNRTASDNGSLRVLRGRGGGA